MAHTKGENMQKIILGLILISFSLLADTKKDVLHYFKLVTKSQGVDNMKFVGQKYSMNLQSGLKKMGV